MTTGKNGGGARLLGALASRLGIVETDVFQEGAHEIRVYRGLGMQFRRKMAASSLTLHSPGSPESTNGHSAEHTESLSSLASQLGTNVIEMKAPQEPVATPVESQVEVGALGKRIAQALASVEPPVESQLRVLAAHAGSAGASAPVASAGFSEAENAAAGWEPLSERIAQEPAPTPAEEPPAQEPERPTNGRHPILSGKTVAVIGFSSEEAASLGSGLAAQYCSFLILTHEEAEFKKGSTSGCDLLIMQARPEWGEPGVLYPGSALKTKRPALIIGNREALSAVALWTHGGPREFVPAPWVADDIIWQAAMQLIRMEASKIRRGKKTGRKLVIIGDADTAASTLLHAVLAQEGISCHVAENGVNALALAKSKQADAVIVDVSLPGLDGFQVLAELKRDPAMSKTVTILLTARQAEADVLRGFGLGADDYITKPFSPMEVVARLKRFLLRNS